MCGCAMGAGGGGSALILKERKMEETALVEIAKLDVAKLFTEDGMMDILEKIQARAKELEPDLETDSGRKEIASMAYKVARSKTLIDDLGKDTQAEWKKKVDGINSRRKQARDFLDELKTEVRQPLTDWEAEEEKIKAEKVAAEIKRVEDIRAKIAAIREKGEAHFLFGKTSCELTEIVTGMYEAGYNPVDFEGFEDQIKSTFETTITAINAAIVNRKVFEAEEEARKAEADRLEKVRKEQEAEAARLKNIADIQAAAQKAIDDEKAKIEAEKKAEQERKDREEFERKAKENAHIQAEKDAKEKAEREAKAKADKEAAEVAEKARIEKLRPDKEKLIDFAEQLTDFAAWEFDSLAAQVISDNAVNKIKIIGHNVMKDAEEL